MLRAMVRKAETVRGVTSNDDYVELRVTLPLDVNPPLNNSGHSENAFFYFLIGSTRPIFATRASPKLPFGRSQILGLKGYKAAIGDLNQTANN
jgi:hypothetical protein